MVAGLDIGEFEWYHRLRNQLYHQGNGLTIERERVENYLDIAKNLFRSLFGVDIGFEPLFEYDLLAKFLAAWSNFEKAIIDLKITPDFLNDADSVFRDTREAIEYFIHVVGYEDDPFFQSGQPAQEPVTAAAGT